MPSAYLQWWFHSGEGVVAHDPFVLLPTWVWVFGDLWLFEQYDVKYYMYAFILSSLWCFHRLKLYRISLPYLLHIQWA